MRDLHDLRRILHIVWSQPAHTTREFIALAGICSRTQRTESHLRAVWTGPLGKKLEKAFVSLIAKRFPMDDACAVMPFDFSLLCERGEKFGKREVKKAILYIVKKNQYHFYGENKSTLKSLYIDY